jgi:hypothetical protein
MSEPLLVISEPHPQSTRTAIVADEGDSIWLYITEANSADIVGACWVANGAGVPECPDLTSYTSQKLPPPAPVEVLHSGGDVTNANERGWELAWSTDGEAACLFLDGEVRGLITPSGGYARFLQRVCPWGKPWDDQVFQDLFGDASEPESGSGSGGCGTC